MPSGGLASFWTKISFGKWETLVAHKYRQVLLAKINF